MVELKTTENCNYWWYIHSGYNKLDKIIIEKITIKLMKC